MSDSVHRVLLERATGNEQVRDEQVFPSILGRSSFYDGALDVFRACCRRAGIDGVNVHSLRRTCTVTMLSAGASPASVQRTLGHATARLTLEVYASVADGELEDAISRCFGDPVQQVESRSEVTGT